MGRLIANMSVSLRLLVAAVGVAIALVTVDYVTLSRLPDRVARDSIELALRGSTQEITYALREDRVELAALAQSFVERDDVHELIVAGDLPAIREQFLEFDPDGATDVAFVADGDPRPEYGPVAVIEEIDARSHAEDRYLRFMRPISTETLDRAANAVTTGVFFAVERDGSFVATTSDFPSDIDPPMLNATGGPTADESLANLSVAVEGTRVHSYSRSLAQDSFYQVHAVSTPALENAALSEPRRDVRIALGVMLVATIVAALLLAFAVNQLLARFATRVRLLADGEFADDLPVHGGDAFAELSTSVNRLSRELERRMGQLEDTATAFRQTLETIEEGICTWDEHGGVRYWNRGAEQLTSISRDHVTLDDPVVAFLAGERAPGARRVVLPVRRSGAGLVVDLTVTAMAGGGVLQTFRDTSLAEQLHETQRNFMATAAHQMRTPITTILGFADTLINPHIEVADTQRTEYLELIRGQAHELQTLADAFFTNHSLATEHVEVSIEPVNLASVVQVGVARASTVDPGRDATDLIPITAIELDVADDLVVLADQRALSGVVTLLVDNARKYGAAPITVAAERHGGAVTLSVHDSGSGIDQHHVARVFDPFYRVDVDMRSGIGGAGLGLFTARKLVEAMKGVVRVRSTPGHGTTFTVELPAAPPGPKAEHGGGDLRLVG